MTKDRSAAHSANTHADHVLAISTGAIWLWQVKHEENRRGVKTLPREFETGL